MSMNIALGGKSAARIRPAACAAAAALLAACAPEKEIVEVKVEVPIEVPVEVPVPAERCELPVIEGGKTFVVEAWGVPDNRFDVGERLRFQLRVSSPSYVNVFHVGTSCKVTRLIRDLQVREAEIIDFPPRGGGIEVTVKPPEGAEAFYLLATRAPADFLAEGDLLGGGDIAGVDLAPDRFYRRLREFYGRVDPSETSMATLRTEVVAR